MLASLSIDLDALPHYHRIHGLPPPPPGLDPVLTKAVERFGETCGALGVRGTAFCVGQDLEAPPVATSLARLAGEGHELGNHSFTHRYDLSRRALDEVADDVRRGRDAVARVGGRPPRGFRAPGYTLSPRLLSAVVASGHAYDSSAFPAPPYYLAKAGVMALLALRRRPSGAILDRPRALLAPRVPYLPADDEPYRPGALPLLELPITTGLLGFPLIGTFVSTLPASLLRLLSRGTERLPLFNLELHGIDLLDASDVPPELAARQRELATPASEKRARIERFVRSLADREWVPLADAADRLGPPLLRHDGSVPGSAARGMRAP